MISLARHEQMELGLLLVLTMSSACDDGKTAGTARRSCQAICAKFELCDDRTDQTGCEENCEGEKFRSDAYFEARRNCTEELSCNHLDSSNAELEDCIGDDLRPQMASEQAQEICEALANHLADCDDDADRDSVLISCGQTAVTLSEAYLDESESCTEERCEDMRGCFRNLADAYDTDISLYPEL